MNVRFVRLINITNADPGTIRAEGFVPDDDSESHRWVTSVDIDPSDGYAHISLSGVAEPGDSGCGQSLEVDGNGYFTDFYRWGTINETVFMREESIPSVFDTRDDLYTFIDVAFVQRQQLEAELNLATPATEPDGTYIRYNYILDGDQALNLADKLASSGRGIQSDLYLPNRSAGELHLVEIDGRIAEITLSGSFEGEEIVKPTVAYRDATMLEVRMTIKELPDTEPRIQPDSNHPRTSCEPQPAPASRPRD